MKTLRGEPTGALLSTCVVVTPDDEAWAAREGKRLSGISCMILAETGVDPGGRVETRAIVTLVSRLFLCLVV